MKTQHTSGPWRTVVASAHEFNPNTRRRDIIGKCEFGDAYVAGDISQEDARLIAAAPDLLDALEFMLERSECESDRKVAREALRKAKGEA